MSLKIAVTGAAGFIGSHTVDQLLAAGHTVWGVDNFRTGRRENLRSALRHSRFHFRELDVSVERDFVEFIGGIAPDVIIHLAALVSVPESIENPALNERLNLLATHIIAEGARIHRVPRVVFASSAAVYGNPISVPTSEDAPKAPLSPYGAAKVASEDLLQDYATKYGITVRSQRYFNVYGPRQDPRSPYSGVISIFIDHMRRGAAPAIYGDGNQTRDFVSVHDVARANVTAAVQGGVKNGTANICTGRATSVRTLWELIEKNAKNNVAPEYAQERQGDIRHSCGSPAEAAKSLGFSATVELGDGIAELIRIWRIGDGGRHSPRTPSRGSDRA